MRNFLTILGLFCMINLTFAQQTVIRNGHDVQTCSPRTVSISANDVLFWVGTGSNSTLVCIGWDDASAGYTPTVVVWGVHWNGNIYLVDALDSIAAYDSRFTYSISSGYVGSVDYNDPAAGIHLSPSMHYNCNSYGSAYGSTTLTSTWLRISESTCNDYNFSTVNNLIYANNPNAPTPAPTVDASISANDITYWVGTGNTEVIFVGNWCSPDVALAWGVRFQGDSTTVKSVMDTIQTYDNRFGYSGMYSTIDEVTYQDGTYNLIMSQPTTGYIMYNVNGTLANWGFSDMYVHQGDLIKVGNTECATSTGDPNDWTTWGYAWETPITPVALIALPAPPDATIDFNEILYWVGEGSNEAVMAVNWADTALAWGYRWNGTATVANMMADIAAADPRFSYTESGFITDINYLDTAAGMTAPLGITPGNYWESYNNGFMDMGMSQPLNNGDFEKWADPAAGVIVDSTYDQTYGWWYTRVYPMTITPVTVPDITHSGISSHGMSRVIAYPNPCTGTLYIVNETTHRVELYNVDGRLLEAMDNLGSRITINLQNYPAGLYLLKVGSNIQKILKK